MIVDPLLINFASHHPGDVADRMDTFAAKDISEVLEALPAKIACSVASRLASAPLAAVQKAINRQQLGAMLVAGHYSDVVSLVSHMSNESQSQVLAAAPGEDLGLLKRLFHTASKTLSGIASPEFLRVDQSKSCRSVRELLANSEQNTAQPIFAINEFGEYQGLVSAIALIQAKNADLPVSAVMERLEPLSGLAPFASAIAAPQWVEHRVLPVVDSKSRLLGALTFGQLVRARDGLTSTDAGLGELIGEVATGYIEICADLMEITVGTKRH